MGILFIFYVPSTWKPSNKCLLNEQDVFSLLSFYTICFYCILLKSLLHNPHTATFSTFWPELNPDSTETTAHTVPLIPPCVYVLGKGAQPKRYRVSLPISSPPQPPPDLPSQEFPNHHCSNTFKTTTVSTARLQRWAKILVLTPTF